MQTLLFGSTNRHEVQGCFGFRAFWQPLVLVRGGNAFEIDDLRVKRRRPSLEPSSCKLGGEWYLCHALPG